MNEFLRHNDDDDLVLSISELDMAARANFFLYVDRWAGEVEDWDMVEVLTREEFLEAARNYISLGIDLLSDDVIVDDETSDYILHEFVTVWEGVIEAKQIENELAQVMTAQEISEEFGIEPVTVYKNIERGNIPARKSGGTWLIRRVDAARRWGKPLAMLTLALSIALMLAQL